MTAHLAQIHRYPIKSIGGEELDRVTLTPGQILPGDRAFGVLHGAATRHLEGEALHKWLPKSAFLRGAASAPLQAVKGGWQDGQLRLTHPDRPPLLFDPAGDDAPLLAWLAPLWPADKAAPARLVRGPVPLTDVKKPFVSLLSLDSLAALSTRLGMSPGTLRWRGNLWVAGWEPFAERGLRLKHLAIGPVRLRIREFIGRCAATDADTDTGKPDIDMVAALQDAYGHSDFGTYAEVIEGGEIAVGDPVRLL